MTWTFRKYTVCTTATCGQQTAFCQSSHDNLIMLIRFKCWNQTCELCNRFFIQRQQRMIQLQGLITSLTHEAHMRCSSADFFCGSHIKWKLFFLFLPYKEECIGRIITEFTSRFLEICTPLANYYFYLAQGCHLVSVSFLNNQAFMSGRGRLEIVAAHFILHVG